CDSVTISPDSKRVVCLLNRGGGGIQPVRTTLLDVETGQELVKWPFTVPGAMHGVLSADGQFGATVGGAHGDVNMIVWRSRDGEVYRQTRGAAWMPGGGDTLLPGWRKDGQAVCPTTWGWKHTDHTFALGELGFVKTLAYEERHEPVLEKDGL